MESKTAIITGGTGNLGVSLVNKFADEGIKVYIPVRSLKKFNDIFDSSLKEGGEFKLRKIFAFECDISSDTAVSEFVDSVSAIEKNKIHYLINTAGGIHPLKNVEDFDTASFMENFDVNFLSAFRFTRSVLKYMKEINFGRIVCIGSITGREPAPGWLAYSVSKSALVSLMDIISKEYKDFGIRGNVIIPGIIDTPSNREWGTEEEIKNWIKPEKISEIIYSLINDSITPTPGTIIKLY